MALLRRALWSIRCQAHYTHSYDPASEFGLGVSVGHVNNFGNFQNFENSNSFFEIHLLSVYIECQE